MRVTTLQKGKTYTLKMFCGPVRATYDGLCNTPSGYLWAFRGEENIIAPGMIVNVGQVFCLPYNATGIEIYLP